MGPPNQGYDQGGYNQGPPQQQYGQAPSAWDQYGGQQSHSPYPPQDQGYGAPPPQHGYNQGGYNQGPPQAQYGQQPAYDQQRDHSPYPPAGPTCWTRSICRS